MSYSHPDNGAAVICIGTINGPTKPLALPKLVLPNAIAKVEFISGMVPPKPRPIIITAIKSMKRFVAKIRIAIPRPWNKRDINRYKSNKKRLYNLLKNKRSKQSIFYKQILNLISIKKQNKAFHPDAKRENLNMGKKIFCFKRTSLDKKQTIYNITNLSSKYQKFKLNLKFSKYKNLLDKSSLSHKSELKPFETLWLSN